MVYHIIFICICNKLQTIVPKLLHNHFNYKTLYDLYNPNDLCNPNMLQIHRLSPMVLIFALVFYLTYKLLHI